MANCEDLYSETSLLCVSPCNDNTTSKINCSCIPCTLPRITVNPDDTLRLVPVLAYNLINCGSITKRDSSINQAINFNITSNISNYVDGGAVYIDSFYITYDYIGLESILLNNTETYIDGKSYILTPASQFNAGTEENPAFLFDSLYGNIIIKNNCCNEDSCLRRLIRIVEPGRFFEISNLKVFVSGCIGNSPFTAVGIVSDSTNQNSNVVRLTSLGLTSSNNFDISLCFDNTNSSVRLSENFNSILYADCVRPGTNYIAPTDTNNTFGSFVGLVDFSFCVTKSISLSKRSKTAFLCDISVNNICLQENNICIQESDCNG